MTWANSAFKSANVTGLQERYFHSLSSRIISLQVLSSSRQVLRPILFLRPPGATELTGMRRQEKTERRGLREVHSRGLACQEQMGRKVDSGQFKENYRFITDLSEG